MYKKIVALLVGISALSIGLSAQAETNQLDKKIAKALEQEVLNGKMETMRNLPFEFTEAHFILVKKLQAQAEYEPAEIVHAFVEFVPVYNKYYLQDRKLIESLRYSLFDIPIHTGWQEDISLQKLISRFAIEYLAGGDAYEYRNVKELKRLGITDPLEAAIFADFAARVLLGEYATNPAPAELYNDYVVLKQDLLQAETPYSSKVLKAFVKFAPAYLDFYAKHHEKAVALSDGFFREKFVTGWANRYRPTTLHQVLSNIEVEMLAGGDAYRYRNADELVKIYKQEKHKKDRLTQEEAEAFVNVSTRILKGKYFSEN